MIIINHWRNFFHKPYPNFFLGLFLLVIPFYHPSLFFLHFFAFIPLFNILCSNKIKSKSFFFYLFCFYFIYHTIHHSFIFFINDSYPFLLKLLYFFVYACFLSFFFSILLLICHFKQKKKILIVFLGCWLFIEKIKEFILLDPFSYLAYAQQNNLILINYLPSLNLVSFSFLIIIINIILYKLNIKLSIIIVICLMIFNYYQSMNEISESLDINILANYSNKKFNELPKSLDEFLIDLSKLLTSFKNEKKIDLIIFPEQYLQSSPKDLKSVLKNTSISMLIGGNYYKNNQYFNVVYHIHENKLKVITKEFLVPFAEFWPLPIGKNIFENYRSLNQFNIKSSVKTIKVKQKLINVYICYEIFDKTLIKKYEEKNSNLIIVLSNFSWNNSYLLKEKFISRAVLLSKTYKKPLFLITNNGESLVTNQNGKKLFNASKNYPSIQKL